MQTFSQNITGENKGATAKKPDIWPILQSMFSIKREEECAKSKGESCKSKQFIQKGNVVVKGRVIPCMLSLIKYVAQRKCALFYARPLVSLSTNHVVDKHRPASLG